MSSDWKLQYIMWRKNTEKEFRWLGVCYWTGLSDSLLLANVKTHARVFLFSHGFILMSISNNSLSVVLCFSQSHKYATYCRSNWFHIVDGNALVCLWKLLLIFIFVNQRICLQKRN